MIFLSDVYQHIANDSTELPHKPLDIVLNDCDDKMTPPHDSWQTQSSRIQSMVVQNDGSIILCENEVDVARQTDITTSRPRIEVLEILSPTDYIRGKQKTLSLDSEHSFHFQ